MSDSATKENCTLDSSNPTKPSVSIGGVGIDYKESLERDGMFAVIDPGKTKRLTGAQQEAIDDARLLRRTGREENALEQYKRIAALKKQTLTDDTNGGIEVPEEIAKAWCEVGTEAFVQGVTQAYCEIRGTGMLLPYKANGSRRTVYVAGPMTGIEACNSPAFDAARDDLTSKGFKAITPADIDREVGFDPSVGSAEDFDLPAAIRRDVDAILECDAVVLLEGHKASKGATAERHIAAWAGIPCYTYPDLMPFDEHQNPVRHEGAEMPLGLFVTDYKYAQAIGKTAQEMKDDCIISDEALQREFDRCFDSKDRRVLQVEPWIGARVERFEKILKDAERLKDGDTVVKDRKIPTTGNSKSENCHAKH